YSDEARVRGLRRRGGSPLSATMAQSGRPGPRRDTRWVERRLSKHPPASSDSTPAFKDCVAEPDQRRVRLEPLRLREERPEPRVGVVLLVGLVIRGEEVLGVNFDSCTLHACV